MPPDGQPDEPMFQVSEELGQLLADHPNSYGQLTVWRTDEGWAFAGLVIPGVNQDMLETLEDWGHRALAQLVESDDPEANGFFRSGVTDREAWYMTAVHRELPSLD